MKRMISSALTLIGKFLRCAFLPNFKRSGEPFAQSYFGFGRTLADVFCSVGQIEKTHPWMRRISRPRPVEVLGYVCARTNWKKPFSLQAVMAGSITLMLICGTLTLTGAVTTTAIGAGQAYATSMFTPPSPSTDLALGYMSKSFGVDIPGVPAASVTGVLKGFQQMMALYSMGMMVLAGFILLYILISAIANTAHDGRFGGAGGEFNQIWAPIRLIMAIGLLVPLPMVGGYNGYNSGQYIVMKTAEWGSGLATNLWIPFATALANRGDVIATPNVPAAANAVMGVLINEFCAARFNAYINDPALSIGEDPVLPKPVVTGGQHIIYYTTKGDIENNYCGTTQYVKAIGSPPTMATKISDGYESAYNTMVADVKTLATTLNGNSYIQLFGATPGQGNEEDIKLLLGAEFPKIVDNYQKDLANAILATTGDQAFAAGDAMTSAVQDQGWAAAGMWFNTISRLNSEVLSAARGIPASLEPQLANAASSAASSGLNIPTQLSQNVNTGLTVLKSYLNNMKSYMTSTTAGAANMSGVFTPSVASGLEVDDSVSGKISGGFGYVISKVLAKFIGGPFGEIGMGSDTQLSELNPLAQLAAIGNWLITFASWCVVLAIGGATATAAMSAGILSAAILPITLILMGLASLTFSAGVLLFYVVPMIPFIRFTFGVLGWLLNVLESIIAIPLVAVAHLNTRGSGVSGDTARAAYMMILSIFLRPPLLIVGLVVALLMFTVGIGILNDLYKSAVVGFMGTTTGAGTGGLSMIIYTLIYCAIAYGMCNLTFHLIEEVPNRAMTWISGQAAKEITQDESVVKNVTGQGSSSFISMSNSAIGGIKKPTPVSPKPSALPK